MGNNAVDVNTNTVNGRTADINITSDGSSFYFAICAVMGASGFAFLFLASRRKRTDRVFHYLTAAVVFVACIAYFSMGSNLGFTPIEVEYKRSDPVVRGNFRGIFYVRYIDWVITTPLLLLDLLLTAGMPWPTIIFVILIDEIMIVTGLVGALVVSSYKWGFFAFGCAALVYVVYQLVWESRRHSKFFGRDVERTFLLCGSLTSFLWILYPVAWGLCEGGNVISPDSEAVFYGVLDFLAKPIFGALLIWGHRNVDPARLGLAIRDYGDADAVVHEKRAPAVHPDGPINNNSNTTATTANPTTTV
ncbi:hypothetical protein IAQ61_008437 [Plenodomus lingam]|uniref:Opsin-like protein n=1 Tax=Leptosphaeria maculans (strain JN3 / isolate v23.1.3 / race Av1-4-5-6-7-8) TaxID=985895 RepID=E4ZUB7_LEPMJ|nr:hypothetical protein LEMA_P114110.1 [Plenodomus lingam JN3]KAH9866432.1 hypothetical protein IAQ61_008437 [Plenodomus lingam]CBX94996.1 hypothetical protein LEMA_P114110.1 [Plenodomus lingam JN3]